MSHHSRAARSSRCLDTSNKFAIDLKDILLEVPVFKHHLEVTAKT